MKNQARWGALPLVLSLSCLSSVQASSYVWVGTESNYPLYTDTSVSGTTQYNYPRVGGSLSAYANDANSTQRAYAQSDLDNNAIRWSEVATGYTKTYSVAAGTSGLSFGAPVTLQFGVSVSGNMHTGFAADCPPGSICSTPIIPGHFWYTLTRAEAGVRVVDLNTLVTDPEGGGQHPLQLLDFGYGADSFDEGADGLGGFYQHRDALYWGMSSNSSPLQEGGFEYFRDCPTSICGFQIGAVGQPYWTAFDTGQLFLNFDTYIGALLSLDAWMELYAQTSGQDFAGRAQADYLGTFTTQLTTLTQGVALLEVAAVPVPAAAWLFGSGLLTLVGWARRAPRAAG